MANGSWWGDRLLRTDLDDQPWLISRHDESRARLRSAVTEIACMFRDHGIGDGSTVMVCMMPSVTYLRALLALWSRGAQVILVDHRVSSAEYDSLIERIEPQYVVNSAAHTGPVVGLHPDGDVVVHARPAGVPAASDACLVQFSSGSTGRPKVIGRTAESLVAELDRHTALGELPGAGDRLLVLNSITHTMGLVSGVLYCLYVGATAVLPPTPRPTEVLRLAREVEATAIYGVPAHFELLVQPLNVPALPTLRLAVSGGERLPLTTYDEFCRRFGVPISQVYGVTETGLLAAGLAGPRPPVIGTIVPGVDTKVVDEELHVRLDRSPYLFDDQPDRYVDGWLRTFDRFAVAEAGGELSILGRLDSLVTIGGLKVDLTEVEAVLVAHPQVTETVVSFGEVIEAYVGGGSSLDAGELIGWCQERLSPVKIPKRFFVARELPRNPTGKLVRDRTTIRAAFNADLR